MKKKIIILLVVVLHVVLLFTACDSGENNYTGIITGNTSGNISNGGKVAIQDDWVYYINENNDNKLYKTKTDGSKSQKISDERATEISILHDKIYYISRYFGDDIEGIYSMNTDGSDKKRLIDDRSGWLNVTEDRIYYIYWDRNYRGGRSKDTDDSKIYSIKLDGTDRQKHNDDQTTWLNVIGDDIYYQKYDNGDYKLYCMKADNSKKKILSKKDISSIIIFDNRIYYSGYGNYDINNNGLFSMKLNGTNVKKITDDASGKFNISGDRIYYITSENGYSEDENYYATDYIIYSIKINGEDKRELYKETYFTSKAVFECDDTPYYINIAGDRIYFNSKLDDYKFYSMKLDGSDLKLVE